jgi:hypothetical protein
MGRKATLLVALVISALSIGSAKCDQTNHSELVITDETLRTASARLYVEKLTLACINGHRYSRSAIERGFKRHLEEMMLVLAGSGYRIVPEPANNLWRHSQGIAVAAEPKLSDRRFGCFRRYWLD